MQPSSVRQDFPVPNIQAAGVTLEIIPDTGRHCRHRHPQCLDQGAAFRRFKRKVQPLLSIGVLNKYPMGRGGILVNEMQPRDEESFDTHRKQKKILGVLMRNLLDQPVATPENSR